MKTLQLVVATALLLSCASAVPATGNESLWTIQIDKIQVDDLTVPQAILQIVSELEKSDRLGKRKIKVAVVGSREDKVSASLGKVPLGKAVDLIVTHNGWSYRLEDDTIVLVELTQDDVSQVSRVFELNDGIRQTTGLKRGATSTEVVNLLKRYKINVGSLETVKRFDVDGSELLMVSGHRQELEILSGLWTLLDRGLIPP